MIGEQGQQGQTAQIVQAEAQSAETTGNGWGDSISAERQAELQAVLDQWAAEQDHGERRGPFDGSSVDVRLTGADVF